MRGCAFDFNAVQSALIKQEGNGGGGLTEKMCRARFAEFNKQQSPRSKQPVPVEWTTELDSLLQQAVEDSMFDFEEVKETIKKRLSEVQPTVNYTIDAKVCRLRFAELDSC